MGGTDGVQTGYRGSFCRLVLTLQPSNTVSLVCWLTHQKARLAHIRIRIRIHIHIVHSSKTRTCSRSKASVLVSARSNVWTSALSGGSISQRSWERCDVVRWLNSMQRRCPTCQLSGKTTS